MREQLIRFSMKTMAIHLTKRAYAPVLLLSIRAVFLLDAGAADRAASFSAAFSQPGVQLKQNRQDQPTGKRKGLHEVGPEDIFPQNQSQDRPAAKEKPSTRPSTTKKNAGEKAAPTPSVTGPTIPLIPATPVTQKAAESAPTRTVNDWKPRWMLIATLSSIVGVLLALVLIAGKLRQQLWKNPKSVLHLTPEKRRSSDKVQQLHLTERAPIDDRSILPEPVPKSVKSHTRRARKI